MEKLVILWMTLLILWIGLAIVAITMVVTRSHAATDEELLALLNAERAEYGAGPLTVDPRLQAAAEWMAQDMADNGYVDHVDSLGRDLRARLSAVGFPADTWRSENLAFGYTTADQVMEGWRTSEGHAANMRDPLFTHVGVARVYAPGSVFGWYWVVDFASAGIATPAPTPRMPAALPRTGGCQ